MIAELIAATKLAGDKLGRKKIIFVSSISILSGLLDSILVLLIYPSLQIFMGGNIKSENTIASTILEEFLKKDTGYVLIGALATIALLSVSLRIYSQYVIANYSHRIGLLLSSSVLEKNLIGDFRRSQQINNSRLLSILGRKSNETVGSVFVPLLSGISATTSLVTLFIILLMTLGSYVIITSFLLISFFCLQYAIFRPIIKRLGQRYSNIQNLHILQINEIYHGNREIRIYRIASHMIKRFQNYDWALRKAQINIFLISITPKAIIDALLSSAALSLPLIAFKTDATAANLIPVIGVIGMVILRVLPQVSNLYASFISVQGGLASLNDITEITQDSPHDNIEHRQVVTQALSHVKTGVRLHGVNFRYHANAKQTFANDLTVSIEPGDKVALIGPNGSGKSTLLDIIMSLTSPTTGTISYISKDGSISIQRPKISLVPQNVLIIADTLRNNLSFNTEHSDEVIIDALNLVGLDGWDLNYTLQEGGANLSGGQKQRISIARALIKSPGLLILDEFTSAVDHETSLQLFKLINKLDCTVIAVSHNNDILKYTNKEIRLNDT